ncbi:MAG: Na/Pi cotransporter family protein [Bacteroidales bacterium]|nr:Na/Pi cotransporter family protein [Bacteroidales bacterium]
MQNIEWFSLITGILGGLVFFLYGMDLMSSGLKSGLGDKMRIIFTKLNKNRFSAMLTGIIATAITQSTGATTVMLMSFVETNIMQFAQTVPIIIGANIGSTVTAQVIAFDIAGYAIIPVIVGFFMKQFKSNDNFRDTGNAIMGFGLVFFGMQFLGKSVSVLKDIPEFTNMIASASTPMVGLLVGILATCIMQSTGMFTGILVVFAKEGLMGIEQAYPLLVGSSIGTCLLIIIVSIGTSVNCKRTMMAHVFTKIVGAFVFILLTPFMVSFMDWFSAEFEISPERQIANCHTFFYTSVSFFLIIFSNTIVKIIEKMIPEKITTENLPHLRYIDFNVISMPQSAMELSISETATLLKLTSRIFDNAISSFISYDPDSPAVKKQNQKIMDNLSIKQKKFNYIENEIRKYLFRLGRTDTGDSTTHKIFALLSALEQIKRICEMIHRNFVPLYNKLSNLPNTFSQEGIDEITFYYREISNHFKDLIFSIEKRDHDFVSRVYSETSETKDDSEKLRISHLKRLWNDLPDSMATHEIHIGLIDDLAEIVSILSEIAYSFQKSIISDSTEN